MDSFYSAMYNIMLVNTAIMCIHAFAELCKSYCNSEAFMRAIGRHLYMCTIIGTPLEPSSVRQLQKWG